MAIASLPQIFISPAPPQEPAVEIYSPITFEITAPAEQDEDLQLRAKHLTPPPTNAHFSRPLSPLSPLRGDAPAKGLEIERFQAMLKATRDRGTVSGAVKRPAGSDLRKEIALKAHKNKQVERRALFLSKVLAPPSPTATSTPKTPPESPAIFHYTLPSPGLVSPLALFESLHEETPSFTSPATCKPWVEQVDFKLKRTDGTPVVLKQSSTPRSSTLPSLEQISARINYLRPIKSSGARLPAFLAKPRQPVPENRPPRLTTAVGRLQMPIRAPKPKPEPLDMLPPRSPMSPLTPKLQITTLVVPKSSRPSPTDLSEANVKSLETRERKAKTMLSALQRRLVPSLNGVSGYEDEEDRKSRRHSAPADLGPCGPRFGFAHPVLSLPGGF